VWTVDFKGWWKSWGKRCQPLTVRDEHSGYVLELPVMESAGTEKAARVAASEREWRASFKRRVCGLCKPQKQGWADKKTFADVRLAVAHEQQIREWS